MATFLETVTFPDDLAAWARGGSAYMTDVVETNSGRELRTQVWSYSRGRWEFPNAFRLFEGQVGPAWAAYSIRKIRDIFHVARGQSFGFRFQDFYDHLDDGNGVLNTNGQGAGIPTYQMYKNYVVSTYSTQRIIQKPRPGTLAFTRNGSALTVGGGAGNIAVDTSTGLITFVADHTYNITAITAASSAVITVTGTPTGIGVGTIIYLTGIVGTMGTVLNNLPLTVTALSGSNITVAVNTTGLIYTSGGTVNVYPQSTDTLAWTGTFDVPVRFGFDNPTIEIDPSGALVNWTSLVLIEIRP